MVDVVEQARQVPRNATPVGWDPTTIRFPAVNTCMCVCAVPVAATGQLVGLHLGLSFGFKADGSDSEIISDAYLDMYMRVARLQAQVKGGGAIQALHVVGAIDVWSPSAPARWLRFRNNIAARAAAAPVPTVTYHEFDDEAAFTVDIVVTRAGPVATATDGGAVVPLLAR